LNPESVALAIMRRKRSYKTSMPMHRSLVVAVASGIGVETGIERVASGPCRRDANEDPGAWSVGFHPLPIRCRLEIREK
jgi:hypothetical protein